MEQVVAVSAEQLVVLDLATGARIRALGDSSSAGDGTDRVVSRVGFDGMYLAQAQAKKAAVHFWTTAPQADARTADAPSYRVSTPERLGSLCYSQDGSLFFGGGVSGTLYVWSTATGLLLRSWSPHYRAVTSLLWLDGLLASASDDAVVHIFSVADVLGAAEGAPIPSWRTLSGHSLPVRGLAAEVDGWDGLVATGGLDRSVRFWDLATGAATQTWALDGVVHCLALRHGTAYAAGEGVFQLRVGEQAHQLAAGRWTGLAASADGLRLVGAKAGAGAGITIWDCTSRQAVATHATQFTGVELTGLFLEQATSTRHVLPAFKPLQRAVAVLDEEEVKGGEPCFRSSRPAREASLLTAAAIARGVQAVDVDQERLRWAAVALDLAGQLQQADAQPDARPDTEVPELPLAEALLPARKRKGKDRGGKRRA